jgi:hypothetical protein
MTPDALSKAFPGGSYARQATTLGRRLDGAPRVADARCARPFRPSPA